MKKLLNFFTKTELFLWLSSVLVITASYLISGAGDSLTILTSVFGVTAVILVAKGYVAGQMLSIVFALLYAAISLKYHYYGEMLTYLFMSMPVALAAVISWLKHPYKNSMQVEVGDLNFKKVVTLCVITIIVTIVFFFILKYLGTANLIVSTISVATSFAAAYLSVLRSPYYAVIYSLNDIVLIVLWILASIDSISYLPMVFCFLMFLANDIYGFYNWNKMRKKQKESI